LCPISQTLKEKKLTTGLSVRALSYRTFQHVIPAGFTPSRMLQCEFFKFVGWLRIELKTAIFVMPYDPFESRQIQFFIWVERIFEKKIENKVYSLLIDRSMDFFHSFHC